MKPFQVEKAYESTYFHENQSSGLILGSVQDKEMRRAWMIATVLFVKWLQTATQDTPNEVFAARLTEICTELETFIMMHTTAAERINFPPTN